MRKDRAWLFAPLLAAAAAGVFCLAVIWIFSAGGAERAFVALPVNIYPELDPRVSHSSIDRPVLRCLFDGLYRRNAKGELEMSVAETAEVSADGTRYTFTLRASRWTDGTPVTSFDFANGIRSCLSGEHKVFFIEDLYLIKNAKEAFVKKVPLEAVGVFTPDSRTLIFQLTGPAPHFLELLTTRVFLPVHPDFIHKHIAATEERAFISNGPYLLDSFSFNSFLHLKKNPHYWDADKVELAAIDWLVVDDSQTALHMFEAGELDWVGYPLPTSMRSENTQDLEQSPYYHSIDTDGLSYLYINCTTSKLSSKEARQALSLSLDRESLVKYVMRNNARATCDFVPAYMGHNATCFDPEKARSLLPSSLTSVTLRYANIAPRKALCEAIAGMWERHLGIEVSLIGGEVKISNEEVTAGNYEVALWGFAPEGRDPIEYLRGLAAQTSPFNRSRWKSNRYSKLLEKGMQTLDRIMRDKTLRAAYAIAKDEIAILPLFFNAGEWIQSPRLKNVVVSPTYDFDLKWARFD